MSVLWATDILDKLAQFLAQSCEHLVLIFYRFCWGWLALDRIAVGLLQPTVEEGYELVSRPLGAQCQSYRV